MNRVRVYFFLMMGLFSTLTAAAMTQGAATENSSLSKLNNIEQQATAQKISYSTLVHLQNELKQTSENAATCITEASEQLEKIEKILGYLSADPNATINEYNTFLVQEKAINKQKLTKCSVISYRSEAIIHVIKSKILTLKLSTSWERSSPIWELIQNTSLSTLRDMPVSEKNIALFKVIATTVLMLVFFCLSWIIFSLNYIKNKFLRATRTVMKLTSSGLYFIVIALYLAGYHRYALMIIPKTAASVIIAIIAYQLVRTISRLQHAFDMNESPLSKKIHDKFGFTNNEISPELGVLRPIFYFSIIGWSVILLLHLWGLPEIYRDQFLTKVYHGITVFNVTIFPVHIIRAIGLFLILNLSGRFLSNHIMKSDSFKKEKHLQLTISTLVRYVTFIIATVLALYIAGISFAGVAIAIGALLVGVGFGLQQIVADFIAGLILLTNNVVRPGDFVLVDGTEGTVMKIRLLATEVQTGVSVVLIPNSSLMSKTVTNYTYQGQLYYAGITIVIEQMSNVSRAEKIILDVAAKNARVINNEEHRPCTYIELFDSRGTMGIHLSMYFAIATASEQYYISTELYREILAAFEEHDINAQIIQPYPILPNPGPIK